MVLKFRLQKGYQMAAPGFPDQPFRLPTFPQHCPNIAPTLPSCFIFIQVYFTHFSFIQANVPPTVFCYIIVSSHSGVDTINERLIVASGVKTPKKKKAMDPITEDKLTPSHPGHLVQLKLLLQDTLKTKTSEFVVTPIS